VRPLAAAAGLLALAAAAYGGYELYQRTGPVPPRLADVTALDPLVRARIDAACAAVERRRRSHDAWMRLGRVYEANGFAGPAEACYRAVVAARPDDAEVLHRLACVEERGGDLERAAATMARAAAAAPREPASWIRLAWWSLDLGAVDRAAAALAEARALAPRDPGVLFAEVRLELARARPDEAAARLASEGLLAGEHAGYAQHLLALALRAGGDLAGAEAAHARSGGQRFTPDDAWAQAVRREETGFAALRLRAGRDVVARRFELAEPKLAQLLAHDPDDVHSLDLMAVCRLEQGDAAGALAYLDRLFALAPGHEEAAIHHARAVLRSGRAEPARLARADQMLRPVLERRDDPELWRLLAALAEARADPAGVLAALDRVTALDPAAADMRLRAAYAALELGRFDDALARVRAVRETDATQHEAWYGETLTLLRAGRSAEARTALDALAARPGVDAARVARLRAEL
jgi:predicted Zn-dependent protease